MRITTQMLNETAKKAGLPIQNTSLLNYIRNEKTENSLLGALHREREIEVYSVNNKDYEKLEAEAENLVQAAEVLLQSGEKSIFEQAKESNDMQKVYTGIEEFLISYNSTLAALNSANGTLNEFYKQMLTEASDTVKEKLEGMGITFEKDGSIDFDKGKLHATDVAALEEVFGEESEFVTKAAYLATRISENAAAYVENVSSTYGAKGSLYTGMMNSRIDFWG